MVQGHTDKLADAGAREQLRKWPEILALLLRGASVEQSTSAIRSLADALYGAHFFGMSFCIPCHIAYFCVVIFVTDVQMTGSSTLHTCVTCYLAPLTSMPPAPDRGWCWLVSTAVLVSRAPVDLGTAL
jgi:hypothetical protein